ncbi:unnamed protein product [Linum tenue]|uniref:Uncharacterized protein n=1 Tax=Linum tenue TaxID=586396 RepID=A0AAV0NXS5_9ROSI|nr:unnamed protein product [Linum tenue]
MLKSMSFGLCTGMKCRSGLVGIGFWFDEKQSTS